ncbi:hypothetical protein J2T02_002584 [Chitinophaga terrae (ex Kim and Jung 2007)]|uniref:hypothetical protein n=1 Tax=Chitinophaga terrae (ex Kim and Jung 2007) TaxID=408074 RepID=UPI002789E8A7|nr:hypothetical protein [Chitinophaga terrae (ex Kim and Jung 2007)]MDQ0107465.1 hypothetical protein [Chitinophaga terrae (ex Kim and Jung 2007)]
MDYNKVHEWTKQAIAGKWTLYDQLLEKEWEGNYSLYYPDWWRDVPPLYPTTVRVHKELGDLHQVLDQLHAGRIKEFALEGYIEWNCHSERTTNEYTSALLRCRYDERRGFYMYFLDLERGTSHSDARTIEIKGERFFPNRYELVKVMQTQKERYVHNIITPDWGLSNNRVKRQIPGLEL